LQYIYHVVRAANLPIAISHSRRPTDVTRRHGRPKYGWLMTSNVVQDSPEL